MQPIRGSLLLFALHRASRSAAPSASRAPQAALVGRLTPPVRSRGAAAPGASASASLLASSRNLSTYARSPGGSKSTKWIIYGAAGLGFLTGAYVYWSKNMKKKVPLSIITPLVQGRKAMASAQPIHARTHLAHAAASCAVWCEEVRPAETAGQQKSPSEWSEDPEYQRRLEVLHVIKAELGNALFALHNWQEAAEQFTSVMRAIALKQMREDKQASIELSEEVMVKPLDAPSLLELSVKLATCYERLGRMAEAEAGYTYAATMSKQRIVNAKAALEANDIALAGLCAESLGSFLSSRGRLDEAVKAFQDGLSFAERLPGAGGKEQVAQSLNHLSVASLELVQLDKAEEYARRAVDLAKESDYWYVYASNLACVLSERKTQATEAARLFNDSLLAARRTGDTQDIERILAAMSKYSVAVAK